MNKNQFLKIFGLIISLILVSCGDFLSDSNFNNGNQDSDQNINLESAREKLRQALERLKVAKNNKSEADRSLHEYKEKNKVIVNYFEKLKQAKIDFDTKQDIKNKLGTNVDFIQDKLSELEEQFLDLNKQFRNAESEFDRLYSSNQNIPEIFKTNITDHLETANNGYKATSIAISTYDIDYLMDLEREFNQLSEKPRSTQDTEFKEALDRFKTNLPLVSKNITDKLREFIIIKETYNQLIKEINELSYGVNYELFASKVEVITRTCFLFEDYHFDDDFNLNEVLAKFENTTFKNDEDYKTQIKKANSIIDSLIYNYSVEGRYESSIVRQRLAPEILPKFFRLKFNFLEAEHNYNEIKKAKEFRE